MPPAPPTADDAAPTPVFVDDSGRRHRAVRLLGWCLGAIMVGYLALVGISLVGSPGLVPLSLPSLGRVLPDPAAPLIPAPAHSPARPGDLVSVTVTPSAAPVAAPAAGLSAGTATTSTTRPRTTARPIPTATPRPAATPTPSPSARATASPKSTPPTTRRPSTHPSPRSTKRTAPFASPTPTATAT